MRHRVGPERSREIERAAAVRADGAEATAAYLGWPVARVEAALRYAAAYPEEIEAALRETMAVDADALCRLLPGTQVIDMHVDDGS